MRRTLLLLLPALVMFAGCKPAEPEPKAAQAPPEPTPQEIRDVILQSLQPMREAVQGGAGITIEGKNQVLNDFRGLVNKNSATDNGREAIRLVGQNVEKLLGTARANEQWVALKGMIELYKVLNPGSPRYDRDEKRADLMMARPIVRVKGFMSPDGATSVFVEVEDANIPGKMVTYTVREGEEFHEQDVEGKVRAVLRFIRIIGNQQSIEIEYIPAKTTWVVLGPRALQGR